MVDVSLNTPGSSELGDEAEPFITQSQAERTGVAGGPDASSSISRKRKVGCCDGTNCGPIPKRRTIPSIEDIPPELQAGKFQCACSEWVDLKDKTGFTLEPWTAHLAVCEQAKAKGITSLEDMLNTSDNPMKIDDPASSKVSDEHPKSATSAFLQPGSVPSVHGNEREEVSEQAQEHENASKHTKLDQGSSNGSASNQDPSVRLLDFSVSPEKSVMRESVSVPATSTSTFSATPHAKRIRGPNRSEAERIAEFRDDPQVKEFDPYRVLCVICDKWIKLRNNSRYCSIPWKCHKASCNGSKEKGSKRVQKAKASASQMTDETVVNATAEEGSTIQDCSKSTDIAVPPPNVHPSLLVDMSTMSLPQPVQLPEPNIEPDTPMAAEDPSKTSTSSSSQNEPKAKPRRRAREADAAVRRAALEADPYSEVVEPDRILCKLCKKWVKLRPNSSYCAAPWQSHIPRCIARAERQRPDMKWASDKGPSPFAAKKTKDNSPTNGQEADGTLEGSEDARPRSVSSQPSNIEEPTPSSSQIVTSMQQETPKKRRGRPPKYPKKEPNSMSDISIESEEEDEP